MASLKYTKNYQISLPCVLHFFMFVSKIFFIFPATMSHSQVESSGQGVYDLKITFLLEILSIHNFEKFILEQALNYSNLLNLF